MPRVHNDARIGRRGRTGSVRTNHKAKPFKIVLESITQEKKTFRTVASYNAEPPAGYLFVPVGYPDLTDLCKKHCQEGNLQFQTVNAKPKNKANLDPDKVSHHIHRVGNHFPIDIVHSACRRLGYWIAGPGSFKKYNVRLEQQLSKHKDKDDKEQTRSAIQELFPKLPREDLKEILQHAFKKGSMRVGEAREMPLIRRVQLAVSAHARHNYTNYDKLLKQVTWEEARSLAEQPTLKQLKAWRGEDSDEHATEEVFREFIVIDSDSDEDLDNEGDDSAAGNARDTSLEIVSHMTFGDANVAGVGRPSLYEPVDAYHTQAHARPVPAPPYRAEYYSPSRHPQTQYHYEPVAVPARYDHTGPARHHQPDHLDRSHLQPHDATHRLYHATGPTTRSVDYPIPQRRVIYTNDPGYPPTYPPSQIERDAHMHPSSATEARRFAQTVHDPFQQVGSGAAPFLAPHRDERRYMYPDIKRSAADIPVRSVEVDLTLAQPYGEAQSPQPQMRLQTDQAGQTIITRIPEYDPHAPEIRPERPRHDAANWPSSSHQALPGYHTFGEANGNHDRPTLLPHDRYSPNHPMLSSQIAYPYESRASRPHNSEREVGHSLYPQTSARHHYEQRPRTEQAQLAPLRLVPIEAEGYHQPYSPQIESRREGMHTEPASHGHPRPVSPRKYPSKRHQTGRSRYHDHDSSAAQQQRPLDYY